MKKHIALQTTVAFLWLLFLISVQPVNSQNPVILENLNRTFSDHYDRLNGERVYLQVDKTLYQPGETIWFSAYLCNDADLTPSQVSDIMHVDLLDPKGTLLKSLNLVSVEGQEPGDFLLETTYPGGIYTIEAYTNWQKNDPDPYVFRKKIQVQDLILPSLLMKLDFDKKGYGAGDKALANVSFKNLENDPIVDHEFTYDVLIEGEKIASEKLRTNSEGNAEVLFNLPENLASTNGLLNLRIDYDDAVESISRSVPILLNKLQLEFYPEGGDMVVNQSTRIGFQALNEHGKPTDIEGRIVDDNGFTVAEFESFHRGLGAFNFTALNGRIYYAAIDRPVGIHEVFQLPVAKKTGITLNLGLTQEGNIAVKITADRNEEVFLVTQIRGRINAEEAYSVIKGENHYEIDASGFPAGVAQVTLFDSKTEPQAERLIFVNRNKQLSLSLKTDKEKYSPREKVELTIHARDKNGLPAPGKVSVAVVDNKLLKLADDKSGNILSSLLIEQDITGDVDEPAYYFDPGEKDADQALDYLLMTRGWRRFAWKQILDKRESDLAYEPERARIAGYIFDEKLKKSVRNLKVTIDGTGRTVKTGHDGHFSFDGVLIEGNVVLTYKKKDNTMANYLVAAYDEDLMIDISKDYLFRVINTFTGKFSQSPSYYVSSGSSAIKGRVFDEETGEPIPFANIVMELNSQMIAGATSDFDGNYILKPVPAGSFDIRTTYVGYQTHLIKGVVTKTNQILFLDIGLDVSTAMLEEMIVADDLRRSEGNPGPNSELILNPSHSGITMVNLNKGYYKPAVNDGPSSAEIVRNTTREDAGVGGICLSEVVVTAYKIPLIDKDQTVSGGWITSDQIQKMPNRNASSIAATVGGVFSLDGDLNNVRGARSDQTVYYIDGVRVIGSSNLPASAISQVSVYLGGIPAEYGDCRGGVVEITTKSAPVYYVYRDRPVQKQYIELPGKPVYYKGREFPSMVYRDDDTAKVRDDFRTTIFWDGSVDLDENGEALLVFYNSDAVTTFNVLAEAISTTGLVGRATLDYSTRMPFNIEAKVPDFELQGDELIVPVYLKNSTKEKLSGNIEYSIPPAWKPAAELPVTADIGAGETNILYLKFKIGNEPGPGQFSVQFDAPNAHDAFEKNTEILPRGFPVNFSFAANKSDSSFNVFVSDPLEGSIVAELSAFPNNLSTLMAGIEGILHAPHGCFEQVSSYTYPNLLVLDFLQKSGNTDEAIRNKAIEYIKDGYGKLAGYESPHGGFDWWGKDPGHIGLTAYGILEFTDMLKVYEGVNLKMIDRSIDWLLRHRDGKGNFTSGDSKALHSWVSNQQILNAYILWALSEAGVDGLDKEIALAYSRARSNHDPYQMALLAMVCHDNNMLSGESELVTTLIGKQNNSGSWKGNQPSMTNSWGGNLEVETTALTMLALLKNGNYPYEVKKAADFILSKRRGSGTFGSTQSTVLALKALSEMAGKKTTESGILAVSVNGHFAGKLAITGKENSTIEVNGLGKYLVSGENTVNVMFEEMDQSLPWVINASWSSKTPGNGPNMVLALETHLNTDQIKLGETVHLSVSLGNQGSEVLPTPIAIVGIPAGLSLQPWQLKEYTERGDLFDYYEIAGNDLILYFRELMPDEKRTIPFDLKSDIPGTYESSASVAYLYYNDEEKFWSAGTSIAISAE